LFLTTQGILHQSTCPHTPQQNGIADRKNRQLVETAYTLLLGANVPVHHWGDAILTACFLINRMSSLSLENKFLTQFSFKMNPYFTSLLVFLVVLILFMMFLQIETIYLQGQLNVFSWLLPSTKGVPLLLTRH